MSHVEGEPFTRQRLGERVRGFRIRQRLTQAELARRAGVSITTVYKIEVGASVRDALVRRVVEIGLQSGIDHLMLANMKSDGHSCLIFRATDARWQTEGDRRRRVPADSEARIQSPDERRRLGKLGLVNGFILNPRLVMPEGPGTMFVEVYSRLDGPINELVYRDCKVYAMLGGIRIQVLDEVVEMEEGDIVGCGTADIRWFEPKKPIDQVPAPVFLWIGANRVGADVKKKQVRVRKFKDA